MMGVNPRTGQRIAHEHERIDRPCACDLCTKDWIHDNMLKSPAEWSGAVNRHLVFQPQTQVKPIYDPTWVDYPDDDTCGRNHPVRQRRQLKKVAPELLERPIPRAEIARRTGKAFAMSLLTATILVGPFGIFAGIGWLAVILVAAVSAFTLLIRLALAVEETLPPKPISGEQSRLDQARAEFYADDDVLEFAVDRFDQKVEAILKEEDNAPST